MFDSPPSCKATEETRKVAFLRQVFPYKKNSRGLSVWMMDLVDVQ